MNKKRRPIEETKTIIYSIFKARKRCLTKNQIYFNYGFTKSQIDRALTQLRKEKKLGVFYAGGNSFLSPRRVYWGVVENED